MKFRPCVPVCFASAYCRATMHWDMPRLGYTDAHHPAGWLRHRWEYWVCLGICPATRHASCYDARR